MSNVERNGEQIRRVRDDQNRPDLYQDQSLEQEEKEAKRRQSMRKAQRERDEAQRRYRLTRSGQVIWFVTGVLETLIGIRVLLRLVAANPEAGFAAFIYDVTALFLTPFIGLTNDPSANESVLEISSLIAMLVYALLAWGIVRILWLVFDPSRPE